MKELRTEIMFMEALHYSALDDHKVICNLCPNQCIIKPERAGECKTRVNRSGKLYSEVYGKPCAVHIDPIEKKPLFHFYPGSSTFSLATGGCNFRCLNCQNWSISQVSPENLPSSELFPQDVINTAKNNKCTSISFTYSEPVVFYEYMLDTAVLAKQSDLKTIMVSNGYINRKPLQELAKYLDAANIDLKSFDNSVYKKLSHGSLKPVLDTLLTLKSENVWLEITNLIIPEWTDKLKTVREMCQWLVQNGFDETPIHFSKFHPTYKLSHLPVTPVSLVEKILGTAVDAGLKYVYAGNIPGSRHESTHCHNCGKLAIERTGYLISYNHIKNGTCTHCSAIIPGRF